MREPAASIYKYVSDCLAYDRTQVSLSIRYLTRSVQTAPILGLSRPPPAELTKYRTHQGL